jgi:hypothetical protein
VDVPELGLRWAVKRSFIDYVRRMSDGRASAADGATPVGTHDLLFAPRATAARELPGGAVERVWEFHGDVRFAGHFGMLFVRVAAPWITLLGEQAVLTVDDPYDREGAERLALVTLTLQPQPAPDGFETWSGTSVRLTPDGVSLFNDVYAAGEPFEDLTLTVPATELSQPV